MSCVIVTGGAGFIGSHTVVELIESGFTPVIVDDFRNSEPFVIDRLAQITGKNIIFYPTDCSDQKTVDEVFKKHQPSGVIHFAANKAVGESVANPLKYYHNNIGSLVSVLELCKKYQVNQFVFSSSCTVYGEPDHVPVTEQSPMKAATSPYGYTKQVCEKICEDYALSHQGAKMILLRYFNPIGAHPSGLIGELPIGVPSNLVPFITQTVVGLRSELTVFGKGYPTFDGTCIRDYIHVLDLAKSHVVALQKMGEQKERVEIYNVGTGVGSSVLEVITSFEKATGQKVKYKIGNKRDGDAAKIYANNEKCVKQLGWAPKFTLEDALKHAWNWQTKLQSVT